MRDLVELAKLFLKLGTIGFGGPAVHVALMEHEVVQRRGWFSREQFFDLVGATNLIPGPISTQMAIHVGYRRAGYPGLVVAGLCFILPATLITGVVAWAYVEYGSLDQVQPFLRGVNPAVFAVIVAAVWRLAKAAIKTWQLLLIAAGVAGASLAGCDEKFLSLLVGSLIGTIFLRLSPTRQPAKKPPSAAAIIGAGPLKFASPLATATVAGTAAVAGAAALPLWKMGLFFLKVGAVLYGGGYVLIAYLEGGLVRDYGCLTQQQLLDAIAVGQFTPGPILSAATFVGYLIYSGEGVLHGAAGAAVATAGIFLPSFFFVAAVTPWIPRPRCLRRASLMLNALDLGLHRPDGGGHADARLIEPGDKFVPGQGPSRRLAELADCGGRRRHFVPLAGGSRVAGSGGSGGGRTAVPLTRHAVGLLRLLHTAIVNTHTIS